MKRLALVAAVLAIAACSKGDNAATDTSKPAMAPAPATTMDTGMKMDTSMKMMDTTKKDTSAMKGKKKAGSKKSKKGE